MSKRILGHLRTHVIAYVALFFALTGGTAFALTGSNTVFSDDITNGEVKTADIGADQVRSPDILNNGVKTADIADGHVRSSDIADGAVGTSELGANAVDSTKIADNAVESSKVAANAVDSSKIAGLAVTTGKLGGDSVTAPKLAGTTDGVTAVSVPANSTLNVTATCPAGGQAITGGYFTPTSGVVEVTRERRDTDSAWVFTFRNNAGTAQGVDARVTCLVG